MEKGISKKKIKLALEELKEISRLDYILYSCKGKTIACTNQEAAERFATSAEQFAESIADTQSVKGWMFFRIEVNEQTEYILLAGESSNTEQDYVIGRMAACQVKQMILSVQEPMDKANFFRSVLNGEISGDRILERSYSLQLKPGQVMLYVIKLRQPNDSGIVLEMMKNLFVANQQDYLLEMDDTRIVLIKSVDHIPEQDFESYAYMIVAHLQAEAMVNPWVGYASVAADYSCLEREYKNALVALKIGTSFNGMENVYCYSRLGLGRLIYKLPRELCENYLIEVLGDNADTEFDEETLSTINQLFENDLNISETARQLFIHRNTLVYRLERIEKKIGLNIRSFEDAMLFKVAMMVRTYLKELKEQ